MPANEEEGEGPTGTTSEKQITEMFSTFFAQWGDTSRKLQETSEDRLDRVNGMAAALCGAVENTAKTATVQGDLCRLSLEAMAERVVSLKADRDRWRGLLEECQHLLESSQDEVRRLTALTESQQKTIESMMLELIRHQGSNITTIGNLSGKTI
jgi:hypothetical protein